MVGILTGGGQGGLSEEVIFEQVLEEEEKLAMCLSGGTPGSRHHLCKGPEVGTNLARMVWLGQREQGQKWWGRDFPGGPVVKTPHFQCRRHGFDSWLGN